VVFVNYLSDAAVATYVFVGETFIDGQERDLWCNSKVIIDKQMYYDGIGPNKPHDSAQKSVMCFMLFHTGPVFKLSHFADSCSVDNFIPFEISFFCE